jgi:hypothetical protein
MKSARERAEELAEFFAPREGWAFSPLAERIEVSFKEHARDQRHLCAEAALTVELYGERPEGSALTRHDAHVAVMNTPAPGAER